MAGWASLGEVLGGGVDRKAAFNAGQLNSAKTEDAIGNARKARAEASFKEIEAAALQAVRGQNDINSPNVNLGDIIAAGRGGDYASGQQGRLRSQEFGFRDTAANPDTSVGTMNRALAAAGQAVVKPIEAVGAGGYSNILADQPSVANTPLGESMINENVANAALKNAQATHPDQFRSNGMYGQMDAAGIDALAKLVATGKAPLPTGRALTSPSGSKLVQAVVGQNKDFDAATYPTAQAAEKAFTSGQESRKVRSLNTAIAHMDTLDKLATDLSNTDVNVFNRAANFLAKETGKPAPTNFQSARDIVGQEVVSAVVAAGGSMAERQAAQEQFNAANSPAQLAGVTKTYRDLLGGQLDSLSNQYKTGTGKNDFDKRFMMARTLTALGRDKAVAPAQESPPTNAKGWTLHTDKNGARAYVSPDGKQFEELQ